VNDETKISMSLGKEIEKKGEVSDAIHNTAKLLTHCTSPRIVVGTTQFQQW
jgi:hypothetical protein